MNNCSGDARVPRRLPPVKGGAVACHAPIHAGVPRCDVRAFAPLDTRRACVPGTSRGERGWARWLTRRGRRVLGATMVLLVVLTVAPPTAAAVLLENPAAL